MKVLIAEDTEDSRIILEMALSAQGYEVMSGTNGIEALQLAKQSPPDLIISDIMMPEMDGFDLCRQVKSDPELKNIPFIFYTATFTDHQDEELALALGAARFVIKPIDPLALMEIIKEMLASSSTENPHELNRPQEDDHNLDAMHLHAISKKLDKKIVELEQERKALKESEEKYRHLVESVQNYYFFYTHDNKGIFTYVSPSIETILGYKPEEFFIHFSNHLTDSPSNKEVKRNSELSIKGKEQPAYEVEIYHKDGSVHWLEVKDIPVFDEQGNVSHIEGIAHDITERKQIEDVLHRSQKMNALGMLTGGIVHDYNNLLGVVLGYAELLEDSLSAQPELAGYASEILHAGERGSKLSTKLLSFSQQNMSDAADCDINTLLLEQRSMLEQCLTSSIQLELDLATGLWPVWIEDGDLEDAILNLSINALYAMDTGGQLTIQTSNKELDDFNARLLDLDPGNYVLLSVTDTGCGMDKETKEKIFEPFFSTKGNKGTGLGLSQVYGFIERSKGAIKVYSEPGNGTGFNLYFPRYTGSISHKPIDKIIDNLTGKEIILVVDDEPSLLNLTSDILTSRGYTVRCAANAKRALEILEHETIDLMLSDIIMPEINGYQLASTVLQKYPNIKIQLTSGFSNESNADIVDESLRRNILRKPYNSITLLKIIRGLLDE